MADAQERVVICRVGGDRFALPLEMVREVVAAPPVTRLPGAPGAVRGLANVRGVLLTVFSGPALLGLATDLPAEWLVVLTLREGRVGIEVDEVEDLHARASAGVPLLRVEALIAPLLVPAARA